jgi:hypothetical protein
MAEPALGATRWLQRAAIWVGLLALAWPDHALAHKTNLSRFKVVVAGAAVDYTVVVSTHDLAAAVGIGVDPATPVLRAAIEASRADVEALAASRLRVAADGAACARRGVTLDFAAYPEELTIIVVFACAAAPEVLEIGYLLFFDLDPAHRALGAVVTPAGQEELLFDATTTELTVRVGAPAALAVRAGRIAMLGFEHILAGIDHVLFVVALLLASTRLGDLVKIVTAFTIAHSVTLSLAWFGVLDPPSRIVETAIALSVAYVAAENLFGRSRRGRWPVAFGFGLVHGLGFYGALRSLELGSAGVVTTLVSFNLGVELGQLAIVAAIHPICRVFAAHRWYRPAVRAGSGAILAVAANWFVERAFFGA